MNIKNIFKLSKGKVLFLLALIMLLAALLLNISRLTEEHVNVRVNKTFVTGDKYLVFTDVDTFQFDDSLAYFKLAPAEDWGQIQEHACYTFKTIGYRLRIPLTGWNMYKNVVGYKKISCK